MPPLQRPHPCGLPRTQSSEICFPRTVHLRFVLIISLSFSHIPTKLSILHRASPTRTQKPLTPLRSCSQVAAESSTFPEGRAPAGPLPQSCHCWGATQTPAEGKGLVSAGCEEVGSLRIEPLALPGQRLRGSCAGPGLGGPSLTASWRGSPMHQPVLIVCSRPCLRLNKIHNTDRACSPCPQPPSRLTLPGDTALLFIETTAKPDRL